MLNEIEVAERLDIARHIDEPTELKVKRRVRSILRKVGIQPLVLDEGTWLIPEDYIELIKLELCPCTSKNTRKDRRSTTSGVQSRAERYLKARKLNQELRQKASDSGSKTN